MLKRTVVILAAAAFFWGTVPTQTAQAGDDMWDLMDPSWWADKMFDDDHDDWLYYRHHRYSPYWGAAYGQRPRVVVVLQQPETKAQNPETRPPE
jgi:hypothetical protein